ncbi:hypothetical protein [Aedes albopictus anphevirus]|uniref:Uncharacterized protein n=1 Tax=Aedes albopictus anphevirus TaxID=2783999 RepID=A0A7S6ZRB7_9MONO|nr:hypothetical protein [Aedes albopictus anphevirus]BEP11669.1 hypothetical protein [Aedes albopictus anphevirus]
MDRSKPMIRSFFDSAGQDYCLFIYQL